MSFFNPKDWYWIVAGSTTQVYSSAIGDYAPVANAAFVAWKAAGNTPTKIDSEANLGGVLAGYSLLPTPAAILDGYTSAQVDGVNIEKLRALLFFMANQIRALQGQASLTPAQFKTFWKGL